MKVKSLEGCGKMITLCHLVWLDKKPFGYGSEAITTCGGWYPADWGYLCDDCIKENQ